MKEELEIISEEESDKRISGKWCSRTPSNHSNNGYWVEVIVWEDMPPESIDWTREQYAKHGKKVIDHFKYYHYNK